MQEQFFSQPILNSPYECPSRHWELDENGQPTQVIVDKRRRAEFITPIPKPRKRKRTAQQDIVFDEGAGLSTAEQQYDPTSIINEVRQQVDQWRQWSNPNDWHVTPETARLLRRDSSIDTTSTSLETPSGRSGTANQSSTTLGTDPSGRDPARADRTLHLLSALRLARLARKQTLQRAYSCLFGNRGRLGG